MGFSDYRTALVTGASSGIGAATVRRLRAEGLEVHALARDARRLASLSAETGCRICEVDVNDLAALTRLAGAAEFDVLVNNAGQSRRSNILDTAADDVDTLVDVNLSAVLHLTRLIAPGMARRNRGHVVNVSSIAGHYAFGENTTTFNSSVAYHATKAGIHSLSQQLRVDLYGTCVRVTEISPGRVATSIFQNQDAADNPDARFVGGFETLLSDDIADAIAFAVRASARMNVAMIEVVPTFQVVGELRFASRTQAAHLKDMRSGADNA
ncbi:NADP-dependent 3-hydroxy acid dehydrogenase YdfG [Bradyrhizobium sp. cir1]|uniref:SDR family oxidoreductase n=1 Tax=Bradyrhizobium sp. cir1 TaxID=1445730 RepID=UPI001605F135|nr:SDR family oxidoreductase [Bradyrhizobium sp. cir1]MBB4371928.1 NADP-dependent 3-hydroxy acid dehydrogenase YdfG [Bradyrhizobium sp. cir1]